MRVLGPDEDEGDEFGPAEGDPELENQTGFKSFLFGIERGLGDSGREKKDPNPRIGQRVLRGVNMAPKISKSLAFRDVFRAPGPGGLARC